MLSARVWYAMTTHTTQLVAAALALVVVLAGAAPVSAQSDGPADGRADWAAETHADLALLAERYNAALDGGATPRLTGERVTLRVTSDGAGGSAQYAFVLSRSGRITDLQAGEHPDPTLILTTSRGTVRYLTTAPEPVTAFASVFGRLGDVQGPGVEARDGGYVLLEAFPKVWKTYVIVPITIDGEGENATLRLTINEEGIEEEAGEQPEERGTGVVDLRGEKPTARSVPGNDLDGDGRLDAVTVAGRDVPPGIVRLDASESLRSGGTRGIEKTDIKRGMRCSGGASQDDDDISSVSWAQVRCDGSADLDYLDPDDDGDGLYVVLADGRKIIREVGHKRSPGSDGDASADAVNEALRMKAKEKANKSKCQNALPPQHRRRL